MLKNKPLTYTKEDYIRAIYLISLRRDRVRVTDICTYLLLKKSTVSERLDTLAAENIVLFQNYSPVRLTPKGKRIVRKLTHRHRVVEVFLFEKLHIPKARLHSETDRLEHGFSDYLVKKLDRYLKHPTRDPHGKKTNP